MRKLDLATKTGFAITDIYKPVVIRDHRGILFYTTEPLLPKVKQFNLPPGTYFVDSGYFTPLPNPVKYDKIVLPPSQRLLPKPTNFRVEFAPNPNKCTIYWNKNLIVFDKRFKEKPLYEIFFILFHEEGHHKYKTEKYADIYAINRMLEYGFNPLQSGSAPLFTLSDIQMHRKEFVTDNLIKYVL